MKSEFIAKQIAARTTYKISNIKAVIDLLDQGATIPFIARYRKERTGALDELAILTIQREHEHVIQIETRKDSILSTISATGKLTPELRGRIESAQTLTELEDLYLPYKTKRRTRAAIAKEKNLEPFADLVLSGRSKDFVPELNLFLKSKGMQRDEALDGICDIIAERMNEDSRVRNSCRNIYRRSAVLSSSIPNTHKIEASKYSNYNEFSKPLKYISSHQYLAIMRGEREDALKVKIEGDSERMVDTIARFYTKETFGIGYKIVREAAEDCFKRLLRPSLETELRAEKKKEADSEAIRLFSENLEQLLMAPPLGEKELLAIDPGYRTGCKVVSLDANGRLLDDTVIFPTEPRHDTQHSEAVIKRLVNEYSIKAIAVGDGTAGRETFSFLKKINFGCPVAIYSVSENGASIYSASELAREEFPDKDITVRGAVSIGRRLQDPLAELVKIDPKSIGVGQYQHDVDQKNLRESLEFVVSGVVNRVGINVNTASPQLLAQVAGIGPVLSRNIVSYRDQYGPFKNRRELLKVTRLGEKAFEQSAGFLRIVDSQNPLDNTRIHPESYPVVTKMARDYGLSVKELFDRRDIIEKLNPQNYIDEQFGIETITDIINELKRPAFDPRSEKENIEFAECIATINDLKVGMVLPGKINNITGFGAFVDLGIKENGLIHVSNMSSDFVKSPSDILRLGQKVTVEILEIDVTRHRIALKLVKS